MTKEYIDIPIAEVLSREEMADNPEKVSDNNLNISKLNKNAARHINLMYVRQSFKNKSIFLPIEDKNRKSPSGDDVFHIINLLRDNYKLSLSNLTKMLGLSSNFSFNKWTSSKENESPIPYAAWRLLCAKAGLSIDLSMTAEETEKLKNM